MTPPQGFDNGRCKKKMRTLTQRENTVDIARVQTILRADLTSTSSCHVVFAKSAQYKYCELLEINKYSLLIPQCIEILLLYEFCQLNSSQCHDVVSHLKLPFFLYSMEKLCCKRKTN